MSIFIAILGGFNGGAGGAPKKSAQLRPQLPAKPVVKTTVKNDKGK